MKEDMEDIVQLGEIAQNDRAIEGAVLASDAPAVNQRRLV